MVNQRKSFNMHQNTNCSAYGCNPRPVRLVDQHGFGLIEVMIAIMLGLIIIAGIMKLFVTNHQTDMTTQALGQISENARYIMNRIGRETRMAGYSGAMRLTPTNMLNNANNLAFDFDGSLITGSTAIVGYNNFSAELPADVAAYLNPADPKPLLNTDLLILRTTYDSAPVALTGNTTAVTIPVANNIASSRSCSVGVAISGICSGDLLLISDYRKARIFQASSITAAGVITHLPGGDPGNATATWTLSPTDGLFDTNAEVIPYQTVAYYVATAPTSGQPGLFRKENNQPARLLVPNVANFQLEFGVDTNSDRSVDGAYQAATAVTNNSVAGVPGGWADVLSVNITLLLAGQNNGAVDTAQTNLLFPDGIHSAPDRRLYKTTNFTAALRNRLQ